MSALDKIKALPLAGKIALGCAALVVVILIIFFITFVATGGLSYQKVTPGGITSQQWSTPVQGSIEDHYSVFTDTLVNCEKKCSETPECLGVSWRNTNPTTKPGQCLLENDFSVKKIWPEWDLYVKR